MPEPDEDHYSRPQKPNWVDIGTFAVLSLTLVAVIAYTCEAERQNRSLRNSIRQEAREALHRSVWGSELLKWS